MNDEPKSLEQLAAELGALHEAVAELAVLQAEGMNAVLEYADRSQLDAAVPPYRLSGMPVAPTSWELRNRILAISEQTMALASALVAHK